MMLGEEADPNARLQGAGQKPWVVTEEGRRSVDIRLAEALAVVVVLGLAHAAGQQVEDAAVRVQELQWRMSKPLWCHNIWPQTLLRRAWKGSSCSLAWIYSTT